MGPGNKSSNGNDLSGEGVKVNGKLLNGGEWIEMECAVFFSFFFFWPTLL